MLMRCMCDLVEGWLAELGHAHVHCIHQTSQRRQPSRHLHRNKPPATMTTSHQLNIEPGLRVVEVHLGAAQAHAEPSIGQ